MKATFDIETETRTIYNATAQYHNIPVKDVRAHVELCAELSNQYNIKLWPQKFWKTTGFDEQALRESARRMSRSRAGRKGAKALAAKYGDEIATEIVRSHSGKTPRL